MILSNAKIGAAELGEVGAGYSQEDAIVKLKGITPKVSDLETRLSAVCIQYWQGALDTSEYLRSNLILTRALARGLEELPGGNDQILLIDSPAKVYKSGQAVAKKTVIQGVTDPTSLIPSGITNADFIYEHLRLAGVKERILTTTASPMWRRTDEIAADPPKLIILHFSAFESEGVYANCLPNSKSL